MKLLFASLFFYCTAVGQLMPGDTLRYSMSFLPQSSSGFVTFENDSVRVPAARVLFSGQLFRPGFLPSPVQQDTVIVSGGSFQAAFIFQMTGDTSIVERDSLLEVLRLLRWGIKAISYTDSVFWKFHERELGMFAVRYFAQSWTDAQIDSAQQTGARIYYMGTRSTTTLRTPVRGYGR